MKHGSIVQIFADDVLVISMDGTTVDQHLEDLQIFFEGFRKDGWQIKQTYNFFGHVENL